MTFIAVLRLEELGLVVGLAGWLSWLTPLNAPRRMQHAARRPQAKKIKFLKPFQRPAPLLRPANSTVSIVVILYFHIGKLSSNFRSSKLLSASCYGVGVVALHDCVATI